MRVWDVPPAVLCRQHLLGEHREIHAVWTIVTAGKKGYCHHPEVQRWRGRLRALFLRHQDIVAEMCRRGYQHRSPLEEELATGSARQDQFLDDIARQDQILRAKNCGCRV
jgi:hypothetical protein